MLNSKQLAEQLKMPWHIGQTNIDGLKAFLRQDINISLDVLVKTIQEPIMKNIFKYDNLNFYEPFRNVYIEYMYLDEFNKVRTQTVMIRISFNEGKHLDGFYFDFFYINRETKKK